MTSLAMTSLPAGRTARRGVLRRLLDVLVETRTRQAERIVAVHLLRCDDETLRSLGRDRAELERIAAGAVVL